LAVVQTMILYPLSVLSSHLAHLILLSPSPVVFFDSFGVSSVLLPFPTRRSSDLLEREGFAVVTAADGMEALEKVEEERPDVVVLDVMLPGLDGFSVCQRIRRRHTVSIILLTARTAEDDRVFGLDVGADDYVTKPFGARELVARVKAVLRRARGYGEPDTVLRRGELTVDGE